MKHASLTKLNALCFAALFLATSGAQADGSVTYRGQGLNPDGAGGYDLNTETCGIENGADAEGPYLLWVFTAGGATSASITGPWGTAAMTKSGNKGTFKYVSAWYAPDTLPGNVSVNAVGTLKKPQLVISHGCRPFTTNGAWCSPGFWKNAEDAAWGLTGYAKTDLFNSKVVPDFYATSSGADPTLGTVLNTAGANTFGSADAPYGLNAFNATGAALTDALPNYVFSLEVMNSGASESCPIDHHGNWKTTQ